MNRRVGTLSGGQQRRVSLAVALLHNPEILVLDEPTVGVDPLLREKIWNHLRDIASLGVTVVITTHCIFYYFDTIPYKIDIEEARQADRVGLMRHGRLLAEGQPEELMAKYGHNTLEEVFLDLCRSVSRKKDLSSVVVQQDVQPTITQRKKVNFQANVQTDSVDDEKGSLIPKYL
jgi:ABC-type multidrug transport system ATPase subunit